jgi:hypothetical protein
MLACALALQLAASSVDLPAPRLPPLQLGQVTAAELAGPPPSAGRSLGAFLLSGALSAAVDAAVIGLAFATFNGGSADTALAVAPVLASALVVVPPLAAGWAAVSVLGPDTGRAYTAALVAHGLAVLVGLLVVVDRNLDPGPGLAAFCAIDLVMTGAAAVLFHRPYTGTIEWRPPPAAAALALPPPRRAG